jgi:RimJ/RimL family protein N-acetyltransferase
VDLSRGPRHADGGPRIETERLILRPTRVEDFDSWAAFAAHPESMRFLGGPQPRAVAWRGFIAMAGSWALYGFGMFSVIDRASGRWLGRIGPWRPEGWPGNEIGWGMVHDVEGQGYALEGASAAIEWAFDALGWTEIIHCIDDGNARSVALAQRLGSVWQRRATLPLPLAAEISVYGQTRADWRAHAAQARGGLPR